MVSSPPAMSTSTVVGVAPAAGSRSTKVSAAAVPVKAAVVAVDSTT